MTPVPCRKCGEKLIDEKDDGSALVLGGITFLDRTKMRCSCGYVKTWHPRPKGPGRRAVAGAR